MDRTKQPGIEIRQIFVESIKFDHRTDHLALPATPSPGPIETQMQSQFRVSADEKSGALRLTVRTDPKAAGHYSFEMVLVALVGVKEGEENFSLVEYVQSSSVALLFPFARELVANLTGRGRFGPVWLHPFNFLAIPGPAPTIAEGTRQKALRAPRVKKSPQHKR